MSTESVSGSEPGRGDRPVFSHLQYPEGYLEALARKEKENSKQAALDKEEEDGEEGFTSPRKGKRKSKSAGGCLCGHPRTQGRGHPSTLHPQPAPRSAPGGDGSSRGTPKKTKVEPYSLTTQQSSLIKEDKSNMKLWTEILKSLKDGPVSSPAWPGPLLFTVIRWR